MRLWRRVCLSPSSLRYMHSSSLITHTRSLSFDPHRMGVGVADAASASIGVGVGVDDRSAADDDAAAS